ncbi:DUF6506 family protein [Rhizohabitans arisaemae]|uniref:DUF6506 family protein n=1 Tax=Rhizohabitans arisaemae TaxID=2720610 RepID=UPI0024B24707|nr:DUF6506 family protein [Rhizohabitans arisaemae]
MGFDKAIIHLDPVGPLVRADAGGRTTIIGVPDPETAAKTALDLIADGVGRIELCGAFGPAAAAAVYRAVDGAVPVGLVLFGLESLTGVAAYKARFEAGERLAAAFVYLHEGADPAGDRDLREHEGGTALFVAVPDVAAAAAVAVDLVAGGEAELIELYGGFTPRSAAVVIDAIKAEVPVGVAVYGP